MFQGPYHIDSLPIVGTERERQQFVLRGLQQISLRANKIILAAHVCSHIVLGCTKLFGKLVEILWMDTEGKINNRFLVY